MLELSSGEVKDGTVQTKMETSGRVGPVMSLVSDQ